MTNFTAPTGYLEYGNFSHAVQREHSCRFETDGVACGETFTGPPNARYCAVHRGMHKARMNARVVRRSARFAGVREVRRVK